MIPKSATLARWERNGVPYYTIPAFNAVPGLAHGISTRFGGVSTGIYASMNLSFTRGDEEAAVRENFRRFCGALEVNPENVVIAAQTHSTNVINVTAADRGSGITRPREYTDVDGLITDEPDVVLCTQYADCVPLLFVDPVRRVVAASHAGWRGTLAGIARVTVERMASDYGCDPADILVGIAPSIGPCCFEVDMPVAESFFAAERLADDCIWMTGNGKFNIDLWLFNRHVLVKAGVKEENITTTDVCTRCHPEALWSHRYTGKQRGSMAAMIALRAGR